MNFDVDFGFVAYNAGTKNSDNCGANGLPVTPCSITMVGIFKALIEPVTHENLVQYVDCFRGKHEKIFIVFEDYKMSDADVKDKDVMVKQLLHGLYELHYTLNFVHGNISPDCIVKTYSDQYKWTHWALNHITENGTLLDTDALLPSDLRFLAPERCAHITRCPPKKSDVWSFGLIVAQLLCPEAKVPDNPAILAQCSSSAEVVKRLGLTNLSDKWQEFFLAALEPNVLQRANVKKLFKILEQTPTRSHIRLLDSYIRYDKLTLNDEPRPTLNTKEVYYLLYLATPGHKENAIRGSGSAIENGPPIITLPLTVLLSPAAPSILSPSLNSCSVFSFVPESVLNLPMKEFRDRSEQLDKNIFFPLVTCPLEDTKVSVDSQLPLVIRENDFAYQCERLSLFKALTEGYPFTSNELKEAARVDINPFFRPETWSAVLKVTWSALLAYETTDKISTTVTDRQISVDIPRCHQYNDLLASPSGHTKLTRILKAWLRHNEHLGYVYWQGLDSLAAPFVILNFGNEAQAFACFNAFIHKYLRGFFNKDNSQTIQEYLALFSHLLAFHDPKLFNHLDELGFTPELYAIPWFLTMFTHVLPLHKTIHLWDTLLLGEESFPLCVGVSILLQLRSQLINYSFNDCILIFSDLPELNIELCVKEAVRLFNSTPKSAMLRDLVPLDELRSEVAPRIDIEELKRLVQKDMRGKVAIVDMRSVEHLATFGPIYGAVVGFGAKNYIKDSLPANYEILVIVNDAGLAGQLIRDDVPRVCSFIWNEVVPRELQLE